MKLAELLSGIEIIEGCYDPELEVTGVSYDSRETKPGPSLCRHPRLCLRRLPVHPQGA